VFVAPIGRGAPPDDHPGWDTVKFLLLAVEVVSPGSARSDRVDKRDYYMKAGVPEYWVVDVDARVIERWTPGRETPRIEHTAMEWHPAGAAVSLTIDLATLFDRIWTRYRQLRAR
jgi:Uma2 family endonuclease